MPTLRVEMFAGRTVEQKRALARELTDATVRALGVPASERLHDSLLLTIPAMMFAEGFTTGALLTLFVAYRPQWVATFHDADYLGS